MAPQPNHRWFTRVILLFMATTVVSLVALAGISAAFLWNLRLQTELEGARASAQRAAGVYARLKEDAAAFNSSLYEVSNLAHQLGILVTQGQSAYLGYRLNSISSDTAGPGVGVPQFFSNFIDSHPAVQRIGVFSPGLQAWFFFYPVRKSEYLEVGDQHPGPGRAQLDRYRALVSGGDLAFLDEEGRGILAEVYPIRETLDDRLQAQLFLEFDLTRALARSPGDHDPDRVIVLAAGQPLVDTGGPRKGDPGFYRDLLRPGPGSIELAGTQLVHPVKLENPPADLIVVHPLGPAPADLGLILWSAAVLILLGVGIATMAVRYYWRRLKDLLAGIEALRGGNLAVKVPLGNRSDELTFIASSFNTMVADLQQYVDRVYLAELEQAKAETLAFQSQVNPHFLFNTLEVIRMRAVIHGTDDVAEMIYILSSLFRRMVREGMHITLEDELRHCRLYLDLFRIRYPGQLAFEFYFGDGVKDCQVLKFILQPLIENYILHGFDPTRNDNRIDVAVAEEAGMLWFVLADNGSGIPPDRLEQIRRILASGINDPASIGLSNLQARLRLNYGPEALLKIEGGLGQGTRIAFEIPAKRG